MKDIFPVKDISHPNEDTSSDLVLLTSSLLRPDTCQPSEGPSHYEGPSMDVIIQLGQKKN